MGRLIEQTRNKFYKELSIEQQEYWFNLKQSKTLHQVDTFYYSVSLLNDNDDNTNDNIVDLLNYLSELREILTKNKGEPVPVDEDNNMYYVFGGFSIYKHRITVNDFCDIFICENLPNNKTNRVHVQLRAIALWEFGEKETIIKSFQLVQMLLDKYYILPNLVTENRIDYCFHTNCIQAPDTYFSDDFLEKYLDTTLKRGNKDFDIVPYDVDEIRLYGRRCKIKHSYLLLGRRKSDNVVFRTYNKAKEVIEEKYKSFFIARWLKEGLISQYDFWVYTHCLEHYTYETIEKAMADFYIEFGLDNSLKEQIKNIVNNENSTYRDIKKVIVGVVPYPTTILNFEYQTMRKFYYLGDDIIYSLPYKSSNNNILDTYLNKLFKIIDNRKIYIEYLTSITVSFKKLYPNDDKDIYMRFWKRIRSTKMSSIVDVDFCREYKKNIDVALQKRKIDSCVASLSIINGNDNNGYLEDYQEQFAWINDNDIKNIDENVYYKRVKNKKMKALKSILNKKNNNSSPSNEN